MFENQLTDLQNGDRFYYLLRTPGMNLRAQLESNSFAELIMRNTNAHSLKADAFATADCKFQLGNLAGTPAGYTASGTTVADDATTECQENLLLLRKPDGTIQYMEKNTVDPSGINGQSVYNGTANADRVTGGNDNDTFLGNEGNDVIEGNGGDDIALGGDGNDRVTDLSGADVLKGGPGNDYLNSGIGDDINMGGDGQDFTNGGANDNETFAGEGNDFVQSGDGADATFGDGGDDWIQGGSGQDLLIGDHGAPFFDDPAQTKPGNDIFVGQVGENDYDAEGGDDIMSSNAAIDRYAGAAGFDWATHQYDTVAADDDMKINNNLIGVPLPVVVNRDRWQEVEANSGSKFDDVIRGDDAVPSTVGGAGFSGCDVLDQTGINRIAGLGAILPAPTTPLAPVAALSPMGVCPLTGPVWGDGNILIGGLGSDKLEGRGGDDVIDGDRYMKIRISVRDDAGAEIGTTDLMERQYQTGNPLSLAAAVAAGVVNPGNLVAVREIVTPTALETAGNRDVAIFSGPRANYTVTTTGGDGTLGSAGSTTTVVDNVGVDGTDTIRNIEFLQFADNVLPNAPVIGTATAGAGQATVTWTAPTVGIADTFSVKVLDVTTNAAGVQVGALRTAPAGATSLVVTGLTNGSQYRFQVLASNALGDSPFSAASNTVSSDDDNRTGSADHRHGHIREHFGDPDVDRTGVQRRIRHHRVHGEGLRRNRPGPLAGGHRKRRNRRRDGSEQRDVVHVRRRRRQRGGYGRVLGPNGIGEAGGHSGNAGHRDGHGRERFGDRDLDRTDVQRWIPHHGLHGEGLRRNRPGPHAGGHRKRRNRRRDGSDQRDGVHVRRGHRQRGWYGPDSRPERQR